MPNSNDQRAPRIHNARMPRWQYTFMTPDDEMIELTRDAFNHNKYQAFWVLRDGEHRAIGTIQRINATKWLAVGYTDDTKRYVERGMRKAATAMLEGYRGKNEG